MTTCAKLQQYLDHQAIKWFSARELLSRQLPAGPKVVVPPQDLWPNIIPTLRIADGIRDELGGPVHVWSAYRTPAYNSLVNSDKPEHPAFRALDLHYPPDLNQLIEVATYMIAAADEIGVPTGLGLYPWGVHIDVGSTRNWARRWDER